MSNIFPVASSNLFNPLPGRSTNVFKRDYNLNQSARVQSSAASNISDVVDLSPVAQSVLNNYEAQHYNDNIINSSSETFDYFLDQAEAENNNAPNNNELNHAVFNALLTVQGGYSNDASPEDDKNISDDPYTALLALATSDPSAEALGGPSQTIDALSLSNITNDQIVAQNPNPQTFNPFFGFSILQ